MFNSIFLIVFSVALLVANIYCFVKKQYPYLFFPCILFLPEYYAVEFSRSLPLLTVARMMFLVFYVYAFINKRKSLKDFKIKELPMEYYFIIGYFLLRLLSSAYYITSNSQSIKTAFEIVFEELLLLVAFAMLAPTRNEIIKLIKSVVWAAAFLFVAGIIESLSSYRIFDALFTVNRNMLNDHYFRFTLMRATTTLGLPIFYGNMCLFMLPLILFLYNHTKQKRYLFVLFLDIMATIHSGSRANNLFLVLLFVIYAFVRLFRAKEKKSFFINAAAVIGITLITIVAISSIQETYRFFYVTSAKSTLNQVGFHFDLKKNVPTGVTSTSGNSDGSGSRLAQFSGMYYTFNTSPVFGLGAGAQDRREVQIFSRGHWHPVATYDVGYAQIFCDEGIVGFIGYMLLLLSFLVKKRNKNDDSLELKTIYLLPASYILGMLTTANLYSFLFLIVVVFNGYIDSGSEEVKA